MGPFGFYLGFTYHGHQNAYPGALIRSYQRHWLQTAQSWVLLWDFLRPEGTVSQTYAPSLEQRASPNGTGQREVPSRPSPTALMQKSSPAGEHPGDFWRLMLRLKHRSLSSAGSSSSLMPPQMLPLGILHREPPTRRHFIERILLADCTATDSVCKPSRATSGGRSKGSAFPVGRRSISECVVFY